MAAKVNEQLSVLENLKIYSIIWPQVLRVYKAKKIASNCGQMTSTNLLALEKKMKTITSVI